MPTSVRLLLGLLVLPLAVTTVTPGQQPATTGETPTNPFAGRTGAVREKLLKDGGGTAASEAAVARGLEWLALHQANDGSWSMNDYNATTREKPFGLGGKVVAWDGGDKGGGLENKVAATAFALLPFLAAGQTHKASKDNKVDYSKTVRAGLDFLLVQQKRVAVESARTPPGQFNPTGAFDASGGGGAIYAHGVATLAVAEAYGMTKDPALKAAVQAATRYIVGCQHDEGGWRYSPKQAGDLSVTGWMVLALKTGEAAGQPVPKEIWSRLDKFLDATADAKNGGYGYTPGGQAARTMTAVGILCRLHRGVTPKDAALLKATAAHLKKNPPTEAMKEFYYAYYATQALRQMGGDEWDFWNLGPGGKGDDGLRDLLVKAQDLGDAKPQQAGSWAATKSFHDNQSRLLATSLALLCLEAYYRHPPLHPREAARKDEPE